jgi:hypothetical protein
MTRVGAVALVGLLALLGGTSSADAASSSKDQAILTAGVIQASDVPSTWQASPQMDPGAKAFGGKSCRSIAALVAAAHKGPHALSPQFADPSSHGLTTAANMVYAFKNTKGARAYFGILTSGNAAGCLRTSAQQTLGSKAQVGPMTPIPNLAGVADQGAGYEASIQQAGGQGTVILDYLGVRVGRSFAGFTFLNPAVTLPNGPQLMRAVVTRLTPSGA